MSDDFDDQQKGPELDDASIKGHLEETLPDNYTADEGGLHLSDSEPQHTDTELVPLGADDLDSMPAYLFDGPDAEGQERRTDEQPCAGTDAAEVPPGAVAPPKAKRRDLYPHLRPKPMSQEESIAEIARLSGQHEVIPLLDDAKALEVEPDSATHADNEARAVDLLDPPGIAGDICQLIRLRARRERPELYPAAAFQLLALLSEGRRSQYTDHLNLITLGIAITGAGKEIVQDTVKRLANRLDISWRVYSDPGSFKEMILNLIGADGRTLYIVDEVHSLLNSIKSKTAASYETKIEAEILKMTTTALYTFRGTEKRSVVQQLVNDVRLLNKKLEEAPDDENAIKLKRVIERLERHINYLNNGWPDPFVSIMGHSVPERLDQIASDPENIASGLIGRSLVTRCPETAEPLKLDLNDYDANILEAELLERLGRVQRTKIAISATAEADSFLRSRIAFYEAEEQRNNEHLGAIYRRASEHLVKVASLAAVEAGEINLDHARYAAAMVEQSIADIRYLLIQAIARKAGAGEAVLKGHARLKILKNIGGKSLQRSAICRMVTRSIEWVAMQNNEPHRDLFGELLSKMVADGDLVIVHEGQRERYRVKTRPAGQRVK